jgi:zinc protease
MRRNELMRALDARHAAILLAAIALATASVAPAIAQTGGGARRATAKSTAKAMAKPAGQRPTSAPAVGPARAVKLPPARERRLANGLRVLFLENHEQPVVTMAVMIRSGAAAEPAEKAGLAQMTAGLLDQGTESRTAAEIAETIDSAGGALGASAGWDATTVTTTVLRNRADVAASLLGDVIMHPAFAPEEIDRVREQTLNGLQLSRSDAGAVADEVFEKIVLGGSPYGHPASGTPESVRAITRDDIVAYHKAHFLPNNATIAVVGDLAEKEAFDLVEKSLGAWAKGELPPDPKAVAPEAGKLRIVILDKPDAAQTEIRAGMAGIGRADADYFPAVVTNAILGATPFTSRIESELRVKRGLTYGARSSFDARRLGGTFAVETNTKTATTAESLRVILDEVARLRDTDVPADELAQRKNYLTGVFLVSLETPEAVATRLLQAELYGLGGDYIERYTSRVEAVTPADVRRIATNRIVPDRFVVVLAGNAAGFESEVAKIGTVEKIPFSAVDVGSDTLRRETKLAAGGPAAGGAPAGDPAAGAALAAKTIAALGGEKFTAQKSVVLKGAGSVTGPGGQVLEASSIVSYELYPRKMRTELNLGMFVVTIWSDGERTWLEAAGQRQEITPQVKEMAFYGIDTLRELGTTYTARGLADAEIDGKTMHVFTVSDAEGHTTTFYVDSKTSLPAKIAYTAAGDAYELRFGGYLESGGLQIPSKVEQWKGGQKQSEFNYTSAEVNVDVDPTLFAPPGS